jgi:chlorobactene glucosyltransferase
MELFMFVASLFIVATTILIAFFVWYDRRSMASMPLLHAPERALQAGPLVSIIIPARNEEAVIERCLTGVLAQDYPNYEVIVIDDNSSDATGQIVERLAQAHGNLRLVRGSPLPEGWVGKCHACQQGAALAQGEWLLFLDADTAPHSGLTSALCHYAISEQRDLVTLFPFLELGSFWERVIMPTFIALILVIFPAKRQNAPDARPDELIANGQCIFVRASSYWAIDGHTAVRNEVLEDVRLVQALRVSGARTAAVWGAEFLAVRMYVNGAQVFQGLAKHVLAGLRSSGGRAALGGTRQFALAFAPFWLIACALWLLVNASGPLVWLSVAVALLGCAILLVFWAGLLRDFYDLPAIYALFWPLGMLSYGIIALWSLWRVWSGRGLPWKGRMYAK